MRHLERIVFTSVATWFILAGCETGDPKPRLSMFVGVDISGSFTKSGYYDNSIEFLSHYLYSHLNGLGGLEIPNVLFVSSIGGASADEPKTFYPKQMFENKSVPEIGQKLHEIFPKGTENPYTDYNAFFEQIAMTVRNRKLVLRPISVVMVTDGIPDIRKEGKTDFRSVNVKPLESLSRNIIVRVLYTSAETGRSWQTSVPRSRVKIWTQDAKVMVSWKDPAIFEPDRPLEEQKGFVRWVEDNVDYGVSARRVD
ncbi:MAG: hypothetical protein HYW57_05590 [Ignavibacteriales bacterium]|nr:hypothetical protein [Ignavibacteriales bacterium]